MTTVVERAPFDIGQVPQSTFATIRRNFSSFAVLAILLAGIPSFATSWLYASILTNPADVWTRMLLLGVISLLKFVMLFLLQAALVTGTISDLNGRTIGIREMIGGRLSLVPILFGLAVIQGIAEALGFLLFVVPGVILMTMWSVTIPAAVIEKVGIGGAFTRSADLTRTHRWAIFALALVYFLAVMVISWTGTALFGGFSAFMGRAQAMATLGRGPNLALTSFTAILTVFTGMVGATGVAVIYYELRRVRDGVAPQALLDIFS